MFDAELILRNPDAEVDGDLDADELAREWVDFGGPDVRDLTYFLDVPGAVVGTLLATVEVTDDPDAGEVSTFLTFRGGGTDGVIDAAGRYLVSGRTPYRYRRLALDLTGEGADFGAVFGAVSLKGEYTSF